MVLEDLNTKGMTASATGTVEAPGGNMRQKAGFNREILKSNRGRLERCLDYQAGQVVPVDPARHRYRRTGQALLLQVAQGVDVDAVQAQFQVEMGAGAVARTAQGAQDFSLAHRLALPDVDRAEVCVQGGEAVAVVHHHHIAVAVVPSVGGVGDRAVVQVLMGAPVREE